MLSQLFPDSWDFESSRARVKVRGLWTRWQRASVQDAGQCDDFASLKRKEVAVTGVKYSVTPEGAEQAIEYPSPQSGASLPVNRKDDGALSRPLGLRFCIQRRLQSEHLNFRIPCRIWRSTSFIAIRQVLQVMPYLRAPQARFTIAEAGTGGFLSGYLPEDTEAARAIPPDYRPTARWLARR